MVATTMHRMPYAFALLLIAFALLPTEATAHQQHSRIICQPETRPPTTTWDECVRRNSAHHHQHADRTAARRCRTAGGTRLFCTSIVDALTIEHQPRRWAHDPNLHYVIGHESGYSHCAVNPGLRICNYTGPAAYGFGQFLRSTERAYHCDPRPSSPLQQARCIVRYIAGRYHTPAAAARFKRQRGWY